MDEQYKSPDFPLVYGQVPLEEVLDKAPNGEDLKLEILNKITKAIEGSFESANRQIRSTKKVLDLPNAGGLLVLLNEAIEVLSPEILVYKVQKMLGKKDNSGNFRHPHICNVLMILDSHHINPTDEMKFYPIFNVAGPTVGDHPEVDNFIEAILPKWAEFDGESLLSGEINNFEKVKTVFAPKRRR